MSIQTNFPAIKPTLLLDFANTEQLDPRITFTRASTATYYGTQTAKAEENLVLQSQVFDNSIWNKIGVTVTANSTTAPDGTTTAESMREQASTSNHRLEQAFTTVVGSYAFSVFVKKGVGAAARDFVQLAFPSAQFGTSSYVNFNIALGTITFTGTVTSASITDAGNGWYRCVVIDAAISAASSAVYISTITSDTAAILESYAGDAAADLFIWGAQLEQRSAATAYTPTTTAPITNYIPQLLTAASGVARFDHNPVTGESLGLLIEESRTNLVTRSEEFDNAAWSKSNATITANTIVSPDGALTGDKLIEDTSATTTHFVSRNANVTFTAVAHTFSVYLKAGERTWTRLTIIDGTTTFGAYFNLSTGAIGATSVGTTATVTPVGNGWYRCSVSATTAATIAGSARILLANADNGQTYTGDGYSGIYIWGAQLEVGAFATSYIPTVASQVTRAADAASMTGTNFSSWYNAGQGTLYSEASVYDVSSGRNCFVINDGTAANRILTGHGANPKGFIATGNTTQMNQNITAVTFSANTFSKISLAYADNNGNAAANGTIGTLDTAMTIPVATQLQIGAQVNNAAVSLNGTIKKLAYYPIRCTDAQLQALTS